MCAMMPTLRRGRDAGDPAAPSWGGRYRRPSPAAKAWWSDLLDEAAHYPGAATISEWRTQILDLWRERLHSAK